MYKAERSYLYNFKKLLVYRLYRPSGHAILNFRKYYIILYNIYMGEFGDLRNILLGEF